jgi:hypothetical protein
MHTTTKFIEGYASVSWNNFWEPVTSSTLLRATAQLFTHPAVATASDDLLTAAN